MTKSKPKPVKPVLAWCIVPAANIIIPRRCFSSRETARAWFSDRCEVYGRSRIIRVEIRPAPKRKSKRTKP